MDENKDLIRRYYADLWNRWDDAVVDEIIADDIHFCGSLGMTVSGSVYGDTIGLMRQIGAAAPPAS